MKQSPYWSLLAISLVVCHAGCRESVATPTKEARLEPPLKSMTMRLDTRSLFVALQPGVSLSDVVDLRVFGPFRPGVPLERVSRDQGEPNATRTDYAGRYYGYSHGDIRIEIAHERSVSGESVWEQWAVYAYPTTDKGLFGPSLVKLIEQERPLELIVATSGDPRISADFKGGRVSMIRWFGVRAGDSRTQVP
jgi:hypothetical protein